MQGLSVKEIEAFLAATPDTGENAELIALLMTAREGASLVKYPFTYSAVFYTAGANNNLAAGATGTANINIDASSPFVIVSQTYYANTANAASTEATTPIPNIVVLLTDTGSSRTMSDVAVPVWSLFGNGRFPYVLPEPKLMAANSQLQIQATNRDAAAGYNLYLNFNGYKLYKE